MKSEKNNSRSDNVIVIENLLVNFLFFPYEFYNNETFNEISKKKIAI